MRFACNMVKQTNLKMDRFSTTQNMAKKSNSLKSAILLSYNRPECLGNKRIIFHILVCNHRQAYLLIYPQIQKRHTVQLQSPFSQNAIFQDRLFYHYMAALTPHVISFYTMRKIPVLVSSIVKC